MLTWEKPKASWLVQIHIIWGNLPYKITEWGCSLCLQKRTACILNQSEVYTLPLYSWKRKLKKSIPVCANTFFWKELHFYEINYESLSLFHANIYVKKKKKIHDWWKPHLSNWFFFQMSSRSTSDSHLILKKEAMK